MRTEVPVGTDRPGKPRVAVPAALADLALVSLPEICAAGGFRPSRWYELIAAGEAPKPAISTHRFARWRLNEVRAFLERFAEGGNPAATESLKRRVRKAAALAKAKRDAHAGSAK